MIIGVGAGTFAVGFTVVVSLVLALALAYFFPRIALLTTVIAASLPLIVFGIINSAPRESLRSSTSHITIYRDGLPASQHDIHDSYFPVRVLLLTLLCLSALVSFGVYIYDILSALPFVAPTVQCRRKQLESLHPSWYK